MLAISRVQAVIAVLLVLIVALALWMSRSSGPDEVVIGDGLVLSADERRVENVTCEGSCDNLIVTSQQQPDVRYYGAATLHACTLVNMWANTTSREGQITIGGYGYYDGFHDNLRTRTVEPEAIDGRTIDYKIPKTASNSDDVWTFALTLAERGEWNVLNTVTSADDAVSGFAIVTDRNDARATLLDSCSDESKALRVYSIYNAAEVVPTGSEAVYSVTVADESFYERPTDGSQKYFLEQRYGEDVLTEPRMHISVPVKDAVISFDLVTF